MKRISLRFIAAVATIAMATIVAAQTPAGQKPKFEVASIKPHLPSDRRPNAVIARGDRVLLTNHSLRQLVLLAYSPRTERMLDQLLAGGPGWAATERFDIEAKAPHDSITMEQLHGMLQTLLADRFQLSLHPELREMSVYNLVVTNSGRMKLSEDQSPPVLPPTPASIRWTAMGGKQPRGASGLDLNAEGSWLRGTAMPVSAIAALLQTVVDRPVVDKTGLAGLFDMQVLIIRRENIRSVSPAQPSAATEPVASAPMLNPVFESLQQEMGLRLQPSKGAVSVLVIESVSRPTEN